MHLTKRQKQILDYITDYLQAQGYAPTLEEIGREFGLSSPATVYKHVQQLVTKGYLSKSRHQGRGIELVDRDAKRRVEAPLLGSLRADAPLEAAIRSETVDLPGEFASASPVFALRVLGDGLTGSHIRDGDLLVIEDRGRVEDGETVVAIVGEGAATVARLYHEEDGIRLRHQTATGESVSSRGRRIQVRGVVIGLVRSYRTPAPPARYADAAR